MVPSIGNLRYYTINWEPSVTVNLGQVFFGLVEPRVRVGVVQDHQR